MEKQALKDIMYGGIAELIHNPNYYYHSSVGENYSHWTEQGKLALQEYIDSLAWKMLKVDGEALNKRAKELVIKGLKGEEV